MENQISGRCRFSGAISSGPDVYRYAFSDSCGNDLLEAAWSENEEAVKILEVLTDRFIDEGMNLLKEKRILDKCEEKLKEYLTGLCKELGYQVDKIECRSSQRGNEE